MSKLARIRILMAAGLVGVASALAPAAAAGASSPDGSCQSVSIAVALEDGGPANQTVAGTLCQPNTWAPGPHELDILVHGATYNRQYWDWPIDPSQYSYVDQTLHAGRATLAYDRLGAGQSSHPLGASLSVEEDGYALHQLIGWSHNQGFPTIAVIAHSLGSLVAIQEAGTYNDANKLVVTGLLHAESVGVANLFASLIPAPLDPQFFGKITDLTYLTTRAGTRGSLFYSSSADPAVIAYDEAHKDVVSTGGLADLQALLGQYTPTGATTHITEPVLSIAGQDDTLFCGLLLDCSSPAAVQANEAPYYPAAASLTTIIVPDTGHDLTLHPSAPQSFADINAWLESH